MRYVELHCHSAYSFLDGASHPEELAVRAAELGYEALALTDHDGLYGSLEFAHAAKYFGVRPITGAELTLADRSHVTLLVETPQGGSRVRSAATGSSSSCNGRTSAGTAGGRRSCASSRARSAFGRSRPATRTPTTRAARRCRTSSSPSATARRSTDARRSGAA